MTNKNQDYNSFNAINYLDEYYQEVDSENLQLLNFFSELSKTIDSNEPLKLLDFGCGPVIYQLISLAPLCSEIHMGDYVQDNLQQLRLWIEEQPHAFNWDAFFEQALTLEKISVSEDTLQQRKQLLRNKVTRLLSVDARHPKPLKEHDGEQYNIVLSAFCLEAISTDIEEWKIYLINLSKSLKSGGTFILLSLINSGSYRIKNDSLNTLNLSTEDIKQGLLSFSQPDSINMQFIEAENSEYIRYSGIAAFSAKKI